MAKKSKTARRERRSVQIQERKIERRTRSEHAWVVSALAIAFLVSGSAGLIHEVVWTRLLAHVFGVSSFAISTVLAAFMGGLALGSWWIGTRTDRFADRRRAYALLELGIGAFALLVPFLLDLVEPVYGWIWRRFHLSFAVFSVLRFLIAGSILLVPTVMMGATLPVLADYLALREGEGLAPQWLYTMNLLGAVVGVAAAGFVLMPAVGVWGTIVFGAALNIGVALVVLRLPAVPGHRAAPTPAEDDDEAPSQLLVVAAFVSGLLSLATQVAWTRVLVLIVGSTTYAFTSVLLVYLIALGVGSAFASRRPVTTVLSDLALMHSLSGLLMLFAVYAVNVMPSWYLSLYSVWKAEAFSGMVARSIVAAFSILFLPVVCAGTILPLALIGAVPPGQAETGPAVGRIYAINTLGSIVGAILGGFVLVPILGTQTTLLGVAFVSVVMGLIFASAAGRPTWLSPAAVAATVLVVGGALLRPEWNHLQLFSGVFEPARHLGGISQVLEDPDETTLYYREGRTASVLVVDSAGTMKILRIDARTNASDHPGDMATQTLVAQIPLLLAPRTDDVFIVGWGSGVTVGATAQSAAKRITCAELEPAVVESSKFFEHVNHKPLTDPRVRVYEDDARHILSASDDVYDVIINEPSHPWVVGVANLFTQDFYKLVARRLAPDGLFAQWVQSYEIHLDTYRSILASFQSVFPEVMVFYSPGTTDTILIGSRQPLHFDPDELSRKWQQEPNFSELARVGMTRFEYLLGGLLLGPKEVRELARDAVLNTDNNMFVEFHAIRGMIGEHQQIFPLLEQHAIVEENALPDPTWLTGNREHLAAFIDGLKLMERPTDRYDKMLAALPAS